MKIITLTQQRIEPFGVCIDATYVNDDEAVKIAAVIKELENKIYL